jgi:2,4'-dihydroxyacetophenone dioxygenase
MPLPAAVNHQDRLLTLNIHEEPAIDFDHLVPGLKLWPLFIDPENGVWVLYARYAAGTHLPRHFHTGQVHFFTTKGRWNYVEYPEDVQSAGSYLYEPPGSVHALSVPDDVEVMEGFMVVNGVNINFDDAGTYLGTDHAGSMEEIILSTARDQGIQLPRYIRPGGKAGYTR